MQRGRNNKVKSSFKMMKKSPAKFFGGVVDMVRGRGTGGAQGVRPTPTGPTFGAGVIGQAQAGMQQADMQQAATDPISRPNPYTNTSVIGQLTQELTNLQQSQSALTFKSKSSGFKMKKK